MAAAPKFSTKVDTRYPASEWKMRAALDALDGLGAVEDVTQHLRAEQGE